MTALPPPPANATRQALIAAGIRLFGRQGFSATSVRQLASEAKANIAAIAYHFGGKEGLRLACAEEFGRRMSGALGSGGPDHLQLSTPPREALRWIVQQMVGFLLSGPGSDEIVPFMLRELAEDSPAIDAVYRGFAEPMHRRLCQLWGEATGSEPEDETVRLAVFSLIGQIMYFRIGRPIVTRRLGWENYGPTEIQRITHRVLQNLDAVLDREKGA